MLRIETANELEITLDNERKDKYMYVIKRDGSLKTLTFKQAKIYKMRQQLHLYIFPAIVLSWIIGGIFEGTFIKDYAHTKWKQKCQKKKKFSLLGTYFTSSFRLIFVEKLSIKQLDLYTSGIE